MSNKSLANICAKHGFPEAVVDAMKNIPTVEVNELTGGIELSAGSETVLHVDNSTLYPNIAMSRGIVKRLRTNLGVNADERHLDILTRALNPLMQSSAWNKIRELWLPVGNGTTIAGAMVKIKWPYNASDNSSMLNTAFVDADYSPTVGLTGDGSTKSLMTLTTPANALRTSADSTPACALNDYGIAVYTTSQSWGAGVLAGATTVGNNNYRYLGLAAAGDGITDRWGGATSAGNLKRGMVSKTGYQTRMNFVQNHAGVLSTGIGSFVQSYSNNSPETVVGTNRIVLFGANGGGGTDTATSLSSATISGYALFDGMEPNELLALSNFFDQVNYDLGRIGNHIVVFGDSGAANTGVTIDNRWFQRVGYELGYTGNTGAADRAINLATNGATVSYCPTLGTGGANTYNQWTYIVTNGAVDSAPADASSYLYKALQHPAGYYIFHIGGNDANFSGDAVAFEAGYRDTITKLVAAGIHPKRIILNSQYYYLSSIPIATTYFTQEKWAQYNAIVKDIADDFGATFVDLSQLWDASNYTTHLLAESSVCHPNILGCKLIAKQVLGAINELEDRLPLIF